MDFCDPYENIAQQGVFYITENIPTTETEEEFQEIFTEGCNCESICSEETNCSCVIKYGKSYVISPFDAENNSRDNIYMNYKLNNEQNGVYECNLNCKCRHHICGNRLVQYGPRNYLEIRICDQKGHGLFTNKRILQGNYICEYAGEIITQDEATRRFKYNKENGLMNYIICVREHFGVNTSTTFIDPSGFGNIGRYLNHSCSPNCALMPIRIENGVPKLGIFAKHDIDENTELTFDYGDGSYNVLQDEDLELKQCLCGATNCRKWMPYCASIK